jgi:hypothetical protein
VPSLRPLQLAFIATVVLILVVSVAYLPLVFFKNESDGWSYSRGVDRISFPGGAIVVRQNSQSSTDKGYITISIEAKVDSEENLNSYVKTRTNALNSLLDSIAPNSTIEAVITFADPVSPQTFVSLVQNSIEKPGEYAIVLTDEANSSSSSDVLWFPRPQEAADFAQNLTSTLEGFRLKGIISFECYIKANAAKSLLSDQKVLLIDLLEDPQILGIKQDYESNGFYVQSERPFFKEMWAQYTQLNNNFLK